MKPIRYIYSETPYDKIWDSFVFFESEPATKKFLVSTYEKNGFKDSFKYAFNNTSKFIYFIKQGKEYFQSAKTSSLLVKPLLIYYGMMSLLKALVLTMDPNYPSRTSVLRHGITTRKIKKNTYQFHDDEIKIQKDGLLPWFYTVITNKSIEKIEGNKYLIKELLSMLPELHESYNRLYNKRVMFPVTLEQRSESIIDIIVPMEIIKIFQNENKLLNALNNSNYYNHHQFTLKGKGDDFIFLSWNGDIKNPLKYANIFTNPLIYQDIKGNYYINSLINNNKLLPDIMVDYMLMYNLGMLCRYETELWGEIIFSFASEDMFIINEFVNNSLRKFPNLILNYLLNEFLIFKVN